MRLELTGRHVVITPAIRAIVDERLQPILRFLNDSAVSAQVVLTREKTRMHADVTLHARGENFLHGEASGRDAAAALGSAVDKIDRQARRVKERWKDHKRRGISPARAATAVPKRERRGNGAGAASRSGAGTSRRLVIEGEEQVREVRVIRARRYEVRPMSIDEAAVEVGGAAEGFLVFRNASTDAISVLFRRPDGHLGLIEPEA